MTVFFLVLLFKAPNVCESQSMECESMLFVTNRLPIFEAFRILFPAMKLFHQVCSKRTKRTASHPTSRHATPRHAKPRHATPRHATPRHATPRHGHATPRHATPRHATPRHATPRHATPRHATPCKEVLIRPRSFSPGKEFQSGYVRKLF